MLKHVHYPQFRRSLASEDGSQNSSLPSSASGSPSVSIRCSSRCSSSLSSTGEIQTGTIKVFCSALRPDVDYKTLSVSTESTTREIVQMLLKKCKMRNRDPNLFYLSMEISMHCQSVHPRKTVLILDDYARPLDLKNCQPSDYYSKFTLRCRRGGLVRIYDSALSSTSHYKSFLVSQRTTAEEVIQLVLNWHDSRESPDNFDLFEVRNLQSHKQSYEHKLHPQDIPLLAREQWPAESSCSFHLRRIDGVLSPVVMVQSVRTFESEQLDSDSLQWFHGCKETNAQTKTMNRSTYCYGDDSINQYENYVYI